MAGRLERNVCARDPRSFVAPRVCAVGALVRPRLRTTQVKRHLAIVEPLLVARLAAEPLLPGAGRLNVIGFPIGTLFYRTGLRACAERPRRCRNADQRDELTAFHVFSTSIRRKV